MKKLPCIIILILAMVTSCSVKENRDDCPSYLSLTVTRQAGNVYQYGHAWCGMYDEDGTRWAVSPLTRMDVRDTLLRYAVFPRRTVRAVVSSSEVISGRVVPQSGEEFPKLYAYGKEVVCLDELVNDVIYQQDKQYCNLSVQLSEVAIPLAPELVVSVDAPYSGTLFPSLEPCAGQYFYRTVFDAEGHATIRLPRQGGEGMILSVQKIDHFTNSVNLYEEMRRAHYDWTSPSLSDFEITVALNSVEGDLLVEDWTIVDIPGKEF